MYGKPYNASVELGARPVSYPPPAARNMNFYSVQNDKLDHGRQLGNRPASSVFSPDPSDQYAADDDATYHLDHLATYTVAPNRGLSTPNDAITRLRHMAQGTGVWTKRLRLRVGARDLVVVDGSDPIERFPLRLVTDAVCETAHVESYNNVVVITVAGDDLMGVRRRIPPSEMHLFHCLYKPGQDLVDDIMTAKAGKPLRKHSEMAKQQPIYAQATSKTRTAAAATSSKDEKRDSAEVELSEYDKRVFDLKVLDMCFGDIENFVYRLQNAAKEQKQVEPNADNAATAALKAPTAKEFFVFFQKVKMSFILLARLENEIRDPTASELVKALFVPFRLIVDASRDPVSNKAQLASQIVAPLPTNDSIKLLSSCLSPLDFELLQMLGNAWTTPRS